MVDLSITDSKIENPLAPPLWSLIRRARGTPPIPPLPHPLPPLLGLDLLGLELLHPLEHEACEGIGIEASIATPFSRLEHLKKRKKRINF